VLDLVDAVPPARTPEAYAALLRAAGADREVRLRAAVRQVGDLLERWRATERLLSGRAELAELPARADMSAQLQRLVHNGFVGEVGIARLRHYPRYLAALDQRRERLAGQLTRDRELMARVADLQESYAHQVSALPKGQPLGAGLERVRWLLEEYRVSLWAQQLGTDGPVSDQRIRKALAGSPLNVG
jgi:ATP-dependent helicase HrpA